jgi:hypothetical protein
MRTVMSSADKGFWALSEKGLANARCCLSSIEDARAQYLGLLEAFSMVGLRRIWGRHAKDARDAATPVVEISPPDAEDALAAYPY